MRFIDYLTEEWVDSIKIEWGPKGSPPVVYDIYADPSSSDFTNFRKNNSGRGGVRYIADINKKIVYMFSDELLHHDVISKLRLDRTKILVGAGILERSKIRARTFGAYQSPMIAFQNREMRKWLDKYFNNLGDWG